MTDNLRILKVQLIASVQRADIVILNDSFFALLNVPALTIMAHLTELHGTLNSSDFAYLRSQLSLPMAPTQCISPECISLSTTSLQKLSISVRTRQMALFPRSNYHLYSHQSCNRFIPLWAHKITETSPPTHYSKHPISLHQQQQWGTQQLQTQYNTAHLDVDNVSALLHIPALSALITAVVKAATPVNPRGQCPRVTFVTTHYSHVCTYTIHVTRSFSDQFLISDCSTTSTRETLHRSYSHTPFTFY